VVERRLLGVLEKRFVLLAGVDHGVQPLFLFVGQAAAPRVREPLILVLIAQKLDHLIGGGLPFGVDLGELGFPLAGELGRLAAFFAGGFQLLLAGVLGRGAAGRGLG
jgi:hypothetical protein